MTPEEIRLEILKLIRPEVRNPDGKSWVSIARTLEDYVCGLGEPSKAPQKIATLSSTARTTRSVNGPGSRA